MKQYAGLLLGAGLLFPGAYALTNWFVLDGKSGNITMAEALPLYERVLPIPGMSFSMQVLLLLVLSILALVVILKSPPSNSSVQKYLRRAFAILALTEVAILGFSLM